jgi:hypothetical protein
MASVADNQPLRLDFLPTKAESSLSLDFLPTKAESTLEMRAMLGLKRIASADEVIMEKHRLASEWQRHQLVPPTPTPTMRLHPGFQERRRLRDSLRSAVSDVLGRVVATIQPLRSRSSTPSPMPFHPSPFHQQAEQTVGTPVKASNEDAGSTTSEETATDYEELCWWNFLPADSFSSAHRGQHLQ